MVMGTKPILKATATLPLPMLRCFAVSLSLKAFHKHSTGFKDDLALKRRKPTSRSAHDTGICFACVQTSTSGGNKSQTDVVGDHLV
jgi:hypothetical protein